MLHAVASLADEGGMGGFSNGESRFLGGSGIQADCIQDRIRRGRVSAEEKFLAEGSEERKELNILKRVCVCCVGR